MKTFYCDTFVLPLPNGHRFPMDKYRLLRERIAEDTHFDLIEPAAASPEELAHCHTTTYIQRVFQGELDKREQRALGFPWSPEMVERSRRSVGSTIAAARVALHERAAATLAGGTHHSGASSAEGFCVFNDCSVAAHVLLAEGLAQQILIVDLDVHQGNGTAEICAQEPRIFTFSMHGENNYPYQKPASDLDVGLPDQTGDTHYLLQLREALAHIDTRFNADFVFYLAGADPYAGDKLGRLSLSKQGLAQRDSLVVEYCRNRDIPIAMVMAGGYAPDICDIVDIHFASLKTLATYAAP